MPGIENIQAQNVALANQNGVVPTSTNPFGGLGQQIMWGSAFALGAPVVGNALTHNMPVDVFRNMKATNNNFSQAWFDVSAKRDMEKNAVKYLKDENSLIQSMKNKQNFSKIKDLSLEIPSYDVNQDPLKLKGKKLIKYQNAKKSSRYYSEAKALIAEAKAKKMKGPELKSQLEKIRSAMAQGDARVNEAVRRGLIKPTSKLGKATHFMKSKTGFYKAKGALLKTSKGAAGVRMASKCIKGSWIMAALEGVMEIPNIISAYNIDKEEKAQGLKNNNRGNKQLAKSSTKVGASVLGYAAGAAATGAIVGSVFPGLGNVVGGAIGFVGGLIGGTFATWGAGKVMDEVLDEKDSLNKTEAELAQAQQSDMIMQEELNNASTYLNVAA